MQSLTTTKNISQYWVKGIHYNQWNIVWILLLEILKTAI